MAGFIIFILLYYGVLTLKIKFSCTHIIYLVFLQLSAKKYKNSAHLIHVLSDSSKSGPWFMTDS